MAVTIESILKTVHDYLPSCRRERVIQAYALAEKAHQGQFRLSGDPHLVHVLEATEILLSLKPDEDSIVATLLHDVPFDTDVPLKTIERTFGSHVARLILANEKLGLVKVKEGRADIESWRRMFLAMAKDLRVIFIRLSERLHNIRTLHALPIAKQKRIAQETLYVYAPIASRLGLYSFKSELEDRCFQVLYPRLFDQLKHQVELRLEQRESSIEVIQNALSELLRSEGIQAEVSGRIKHLYSIYHKMRKKNAGSLEEVSDFFALRVILPNQYQEGVEFVGHCYSTMSAIHNCWKAVPGRFKDYVAVPKPNGYRSLHTTVVGLSPLDPTAMTEIQVRTQSMHENSEYGVASHWFYEATRRKSTEVPHEELESLLLQRRVLSKFYDLLSRFPDKRHDFERFFSLNQTVASLEHNGLESFLLESGFSLKELRLLRDAVHFSPKSEKAQFFQNQLDWLYGLERFYQDFREHISTESSLPQKPMDLRLFEDRIFVLTPQGDVKDLPAFATPIDFAYSIHSDMGHHCTQAKVNGHIVRLNHLLENGDVVEIITRNDHEPSRYWLSFVKSESARIHIKTWFRRADREKHIKLGRELINKELKRLKCPLLGPSYRLLSRYGDKELSSADREHIIELVGNGTMTAHSVLRVIFPNKFTSTENEEAFPDFSLSKPVVTFPFLEQPESVLITGEKDLPVTLAACCKPHFPFSILGHVTRGNTIRIHRSQCGSLKTVDPQRLLEASWSMSEP